MLQNTLQDKLKKWLPPFALIAFGGVFVLFAFGVWLAGGNPVGVIAFPLVFGLFVLLPGVFFASLLLPRAGHAEKLLVAVPLGAVFLLLCFSALSWFLPAWASALPGGLLGLYQLVRCWQKRTMLRGVSLVGIPTGGWLLLVLFAAALFVYVWTGVFSAAKPLFAGNMVYNQDMLWAVGNAQSAAYGMPVRDLRAAGGVMHYHFFTDILTGLLAVLCGQSCWDAVAFFSWPILCAAFLGGLYLVSRRFGAGPYASLLAPLGAVFAHSSWDVSFKHIFQNVNGVLQNYVFLVAAVLVLQLWEAEGFKGVKGFAAFAATMAALLWSKSTVGVLFVCAVLAAALVGSLVRKKLNVSLLAGAAAGAAVFLALYLLIYSHAINNLVFQPSWHAVYDAFRILLDGYLPVVILYVFSLVFSLRRFSEIGFSGLLVNALVPGGVLAYVLFYHYSFSQSYFLLAACFAMWMCIARVADRLFAKQTLKAATALLCVWSIATTLYYAWPTIRRGAQTAVRCLGLRPAYDVQVDTITPDDALAAQYLREHMGGDEVFATNRNAQNPDAGEGVFHYYTAATGRQAFVEGWRYAMDYSIEYNTLRYNMETVSDGVFKATGIDEARRLAKEHGIDWLLVYLPGGGHAFHGGEPEFSSDTVLIYRV